MSAREVELVTEGHTRRVWHELASAEREQARQLAGRGDVHPDDDVVEAAFAALLRDHRIYAVLRFASFALGMPVFGGMVLAIVYIGGRVADVPWWFLLAGVFSVALIGCHRAVWERGSLPSPIGSGIPFAMASAFAQALGRGDRVSERLGARKRVLIAGGVGVGALVVAYLVVVWLDRPADPRGGLIIYGLLGLVIGVHFVVSRMVRRFRIGRGGD